MPDAKVANSPEVTSAPPARAAPPPSMGMARAASSAANTKPRIFLPIYRFLLAFKRSLPTFSGGYPVTFSLPWHLLSRPLLPFVPGPQHALSTQIYLADRSETVTETQRDEIPLCLCDGSRPVAQIVTE